MILAFVWLLGRYAVGVDYLSCRSLRVVMFAPKYWPYGSGTADLNFSCSAHSGRV